MMQIVLGVVGLGAILTACYVVCDGARLAIRDHDAEPIIVAALLSCPSAMIGVLCLVRAMR